jgi:hypothetical protein
MAKRFLSIKNYEQYQHYKQRNPPWIKLHLSILDDPDFLDLPDASKWHYIGLLLLASRHENAIKPDFNYIKNRLGLNAKLDLTQRFLKDHVQASSASTKALLTNSEIGGSETEESRDREETEAEGNAVQVSKKPSPPLSDEEWVLSLEGNDTYKDLPVRMELGKCKTWCETNRKTFSRRRFINWLNRAERPMQPNGVTVIHPIRVSPIPPFPGPEDPIGRSLWRKSYGNPANPQRVQGH